MKKWCVAAVMLFAASNVWAQMSLQGKVVDVASGKTLPGANVRLEGTMLGTATQSDGSFVLKNIPQGDYVLRVSFAGYETVREKVENSRKDMVLRMKVLPVNLNQVVITGTGTHHKLKDSPVPVEVISGQELRKAGLVKLDDALRMQNPSFNFSTTAMGDYTTMNGLQNDYILILVDGKKLAGDVSGNTDLRRIDMNRVKRIEILKGAGSALYGSEAMGGVINIITEEPKDKVNLRSHTRLAEEGQFTQNVAADVNAGRFSSHTSYQRLQAGGWQVNPYETDDKDPRGYVETGKQTSNRFRSDVFAQKFTYAPNKNLDVYAQGSYYQRHVYRPVSDYAYDMQYDDYTLGLGAKYLLNKHSYVALDLYNDNYENFFDYIKDSGKKKEGDETLNLRQHYYTANLKGVFTLGRYNKLSAGLEYREDQLKNPDAGIEKLKGASTWSLYAQDELRLLKKLQIVAGLRYTHHEEFGDRVSPKASVMMTVGQFNFRVNYASGFRAPDMKQMYYEKEKKGTLSVGNPDLDPETSNYYSANVEYAGRNFNMSVSAYMNKVDNLITLQKIDLEPGDKENGIKTRKLYVNLNDATLKGVEVNVSTYFGAGFSLTGGYSYCDARGTLNGEKTRLERSIRHTGTMSANWTNDWKWYRLNVNLNARGQSSRYHESNGIAPGHWMCNLTTTHTISQLGRFGVEAQVGVENLLDYTDDRPFGVNYATLSPGRTFWGGLTLRFK